ncbi:MAG: recombination protein RecO [Pseudomonadota bacterium]|jgi:hypothetical protein
MHIGFEWLQNSSKLLVWQQFCTILQEKLNGAHEIDEFYYQILDSCATKWQNMNSKRIALEALILLLEKEGKLDLSNKCYVCRQNIVDSVSFAKGFAQVHPSCIHSSSFNKEHIDELLLNKTTIYLNDTNIDKLWGLALQGFAN